MTRNTRSGLTAVEIAVVIVVVAVLLALVLPQVKRRIDHRVFLDAIVAIDHRDYADLAKIIRRHRVVLTHLYDGQTTLAHIAARSVDVESLRVIHSAGGAVNIRDRENSTPLHVVVALQPCSNEQLAYTEELIRTGADLEAVDRYDRTPIHVAATNHCGLVISLLLQHGADPAKKTPSGKTPGELASEDGLDEIANIIESYSTASPAP